MGVKGHYFDGVSEKTMIPVPVEHSFTIFYWSLTCRVKSEFGHVKNACKGASFDSKDAYCVPYMDTINSKGLQHLLVNVVVFLDLNFRTTSD